MTATASPSAPARPRRWVPASLPYRRIFQVALLCVVPLAVAYATHRTLVSQWAYYLGDSVGMGQSFSYRVAAVALAERASRLQGAAPGRVPRYRWTAQVDGDDVGVVELGPGQMSLETRTFPAAKDPPPGLDLMEVDPRIPKPLGRRSLGLVENDVGAIVMRLGNATGNDCLAFRAWMTGYTRYRARFAFVPPAAGKVPFEAIRSAEWMPLADAEPGCKAMKDAPRTILVRFDL